MSAQDSLDRLRSFTVEQKSFFTKIAFYEEGEKTGHLLAKIASSQQSSQIVLELSSFYSDLYGSRDNYSSESLAEYLAAILIPTLYSVAHLVLDTPLTLEELQKGSCSFPTCKAPGDDGISMEVYTTYGETILPRLLEVFNA